MLSVTLAFFFSIAALLACDFLRYGAATIVIDLENNRTFVPVNVVNNLLPNSTTQIASATLGMIRWNHDQDGCSKYEYLSAMDNTFKTARVCGIMAAIFGSLTFTLLVVEFLLIRFYCSRIILVNLILICLILQGITFVAYGSRYCIAEVGYKYTCYYASGTTYSIVATCFWLTSSMLICATPKTTPLLRLILERERKTKKKSENDGCCYCFKNKDDKERDVVADSKEQKPFKPVPVAAQSGYDPESDFSTGSDGELHMTSYNLPETSYNLPETYGGRTYSVRTAPVVPKKSFANAEVIEDDLFFDSKTL
jgi:hypothetical protein